MTLSQATSRGGSSRGRHAALSAGLQPDGRYGVPTLGQTMRSFSSFEMVQATGTKSAKRETCKNPGQRFEVVKEGKIL
jgi:hypothetical protein